jgi:hypothetical protein
MTEPYNTNLAAEVFVMSALHRLGADAALSLRNKKAVDITVVRGEGEAVTVDVKGVAEAFDWPADNVRVPQPARQRNGGNAAAHRTERRNHFSNRVGPRRGFASGAIPWGPIFAP